MPQDVAKSHHPTKAGNPSPAPEIPFSPILFSTFSSYDEISAIRDGCIGPAASIPDSGYHGSSTCSQSEISSRSPARPTPKHRRTTRSVAKYLGDDDVAPSASVGSQIERTSCPDLILAGLKELEPSYHPERLATISSSALGLPMILVTHLPMGEDADSNKNAMASSKHEHDSTPRASSADRGTAGENIVAGTDQDNSGEHGSSHFMRKVHRFLNDRDGLPWNSLQCRESEQDSPTKVNSDSDEDSSMAGSDRSSSSGSTGSYIGATLTAYQRQVVESLMSEFETLFCQELGNGAAGAAQVAGVNSAGSQGTPRQSPSSGRGSGSNEGQGDGDPSKMPNSGGDNYGPKSHTDEPFPVRKFACPYYKREPRKHTNRRACSGPGWLEIHRIKEHITRVHAHPIFCLRCGENFTCKDKLEAHTRAVTACPVRNFERPHRLTEEQLRLLKKRKIESSDEDKWRTIYRILFPEDDEYDIPTPYYDTGDIVGVDHYERYSRRALPRSVRRRLEIAAAAIASPLENHLRAQLVDIVRSAQAEVSESFRRLMDPVFTGPDASADPSQTDVPINAEPTESNLLLAPQDLDQHRGTGNPVSKGLDFSAYLHQPVMDGAYGMPGNLDLSSAETRLCSEHSTHGHDSGYGSNVGNHHGDGLELCFTDWPMPSSIEGTYDCDHET